MSQTTEIRRLPPNSLKGLMPILWPPDVKGQLTGKDPDAGKDWGQEEIVKDKEPYCASVHRVTKRRTQLNN